MNPPTWGLLRDLNMVPHKRTTGSGGPKELSAAVSESDTVLKEGNRIFVYFLSDTQVRDTEEIQQRHKT